MTSFLNPVILIPAKAASGPVGGAPATSSRSLASFSMQHQSQTEWCWAAVSASVAAFFGSTGWSQCRIATSELNLPCCNNPMPGGCNVPWSLDTALTLVGHFVNLLNGSIPFTDVRQEIQQGAPIGVRIAWAGGQGAHFIAIAGWMVDPQGSKFVDVFDPWTGNRQVNYLDLIGAYQAPGDDWSHTYLVARTAAVAALAGGAPSPSPISA